MATPFRKSSTGKNVKQLILVAAILMLGVGAGAYLLRTEKPTGDDGHGHGAAAHSDAKPMTGKADDHKDHAGHSDGEHKEGTPTKGPKGGKLFVEAGYGLEVTIFETNVEPEFRIYTYKNGKPIAPNLSNVTLTIERLGRKPQEFVFAPEGDYLKAKGTVEEPHSFSAQILSQYDGKPYIFDYEQVEARVTMSPAQAQSTGVDVAVVGPASIQSILEFTGEIGLNQDRSVQVVPRLTGLVQSVAVGMGERVRKGQVLAVVSSQWLADQRSELQATGKRLAMARTTFEREKTLWEEKISAKQDYLQALQALQEAEIAEQLARQKLASLGAPASSNTGGLTSYDIRSPIDGLVTVKKISVGEVVKEDGHIFTVSDLSTVWVDFNIYAKDLNAVKMGQKATLKSSAFDASAEGTVSYVGALIGNQTRTAAARIVLRNPQGQWHPGLPVTVQVVAAQVAVPMAISVEALQTLRDAPVVFGRYGEHFEARPVTTGRSDGKMVEITKGMEVGEKYAARNSYVIKADIGKSSASHDH